MLNQLSTTGPADTSRGKGGAIDTEALFHLVSRAKKGDQAALYDLCVHSIKIIYYLALRLVGNEADAEDVTQESLLRMCERISELRDPKAFVGWLSRVTDNEAKKLYRRSARYGVVLNIDDYLEGIMEHSKDFLPEEYVESEEHRQEIVKIIDTLPTRQREAVVLCYYGGLSVTEAAEEMGIDKAGVSQHLKLARGTLRLEMEKRNLAPASGAVNLHSAGIPVAMLLQKALSLDAPSVALNPNVARQILQTCGPAIQANAAPASSAARSGSMLAPVAMMAAVAVMLVGTLSYTAAKGPASPLGAETASQAAAEYVILFSGGEDRGEGNAYLNPQTAYPMPADGEGGATVRDWSIRSGDYVLYSGREANGAGIDEAFAQLSQRGGGVYIVSFSLEDAAGFTYRLERNFRVEEGRAL